MSKEGAGSEAEAGRCPICGKETVVRFTPFCSARCKQVDLNRWLSEVYSIPDNEPPANSVETDGNEEV